MKNKLVCWLPAVLMAFFIFYMSAQSNPPAAALFAFIPNSDKLAHMTEYFIFSSLIFFALKKGHNTKFSSAIFIAVIIASIYGMSDEYHQSFVPGRSMDAMDWVADTVGAIIITSRKFEV